MKIDRFASNRRTKKFFFFLLAALLGGCVDLDFSFKLPVSLHPLYTDKELIFEEKLLGPWSDGEQSWKFEEGMEQKSYDLTIAGDGEEATFTAHLVKIDKMIFLDMLPDISDTKCDDFSKMFLWPTHFFMKIEIVEPNLHMQFVNIPDMLENDPNLLKHEIVEEYHLVLTASTKQLQEFMKAHADDEDLFSEPIELKRLEPKDPNDPYAIDPNQTDSNSVDANKG